MVGHTLIFFFTLSKTYKHPISNRRNTLLKRCWERNLFSNQRTNGAVPWCSEVAHGLPGGLDQLLIFLHAHPTKKGTAEGVHVTGSQ
jgi:hypothetical protein